MSLRFVVVHDAAAGRRAVLYLQRKVDDTHAIVLVRDADDQPQRRDGLEQARRFFQSPIPIVLGVAQVERESWVLCGFEAENAAEKVLLQDETTGLGFDPCEQPQRLTACKNDQARKSPKRVLAALTQGDRDRECRCWREAALEILQSRGDGNDLAAYFAEVRHFLATRISGQRPFGKA